MKKTMLTFLVWGAIGTVGITSNGWSKSFNGTIQSLVPESTSPCTIQTRISEEQPLKSASLVLSYWGQGMTEYVDLLPIPLSTLEKILAGEPEPSNGWNWEAHSNAPGGYYNLYNAKIIRGPGAPGTQYLQIHGEPNLSGMTPFTFGIDLTLGITSTSDIVGLLEFTIYKKPKQRMSGISTQLSASACNLPK